MLDLDFKQKRLNAPIRLSLDLLETPDVKVQLTVVRKKLPKEPLEQMNWAVAISGALAWCLTDPPPIRRGKFIIRLDRSPSTWVSGDRVKDIRKIVKATKGKTTPDLAHNLLFAKERTDQVKALIATELVALHSRLPVKLTLLSRRSGELIVSANLLVALQNFSVRLSALLAFTTQYAKRRPGGATPDLPLTAWIGFAAATAYHIVKEEIQQRSAPSPELESIMSEMAQVNGFERVKQGGRRVHFLVAYLAVRALKKARGLTRFDSVIPFNGGDVDRDKIESQIDTFHYTFTQPYTKKLKEFPNFFPSVLVKVLRPLLLGPPSALAEHLGFRPKSAF